MGINFDYIHYMSSSSYEPPCPCAGTDCKCIGTANEYREGCRCAEHRGAEVRREQEAIRDREQEVAIEAQADFEDENPQHEYCGSCSECAALDAALASLDEWPVDTI